MSKATKAVPEGAAPETLADEATSRAEIPPPAPPAPPPSDRRTVEAWCADKGTAPWLFNAARVGHRWAKAQELTETEYTTAIDRAANTEMR